MNIAIQRPRNTHEQYHAHVYFDEGSADHAHDLCRRAGETFGVRVGRFHRKLVGPHPEWSCQLSFDSKQFGALIDWLEQNRDGLTVFVHGLSGDGLEDHTTHATFLGEPATLNLEAFRR
ncbi:MAG: 4,5-dioxygenase [Betaproteobacteria bacterium]|nr:4,5-dioxygenase [Betaproteobacteria bacterium]